MAPLKTKNNQKDEKFKVNHEIDLYEFEKPFNFLMLSDPNPKPDDKKCIIS